METFFTQFAFGNRNSDFWFIFTFHWAYNFLFLVWSSGFFSLNWSYFLSRSFATNFWFSYFNTSNFFSRRGFSWWNDFVLVGPFLEFLKLTFIFNFNRSRCGRLLFNFNITFFPEKGSQRSLSLWNLILSWRSSLDWRWLCHSCNRHHYCWRRSYHNICLFVNNWYLYLFILFDLHFSNTWRLSLLFLSFNFCGYRQICHIFNVLFIL